MVVLARDSCSEIFTQRLTPPTAIDRGRRPRPGAICENLWLLSVRIRASAFLKFRNEPLAEMVVGAAPSSTGAEKLGAHGHERIYMRRAPGRHQTGRDRSQPEQHGDDRKRPRISRAHAKQHALEHARGEQ